MLFERIGLIDENFAYRPDMYVATDDQHITYVGNTPPEGSHGEIYDGLGKVLMPGFYNAHGHSPMSILRGYGENLPLDQWLHERMFPFEAKFYGDAVYWASLLTMAESVRFGIVSTTDMYCCFIDDLIRATRDSGMKGSISWGITGIGTPVEENRMFQETIKDIKTYQGCDEGRIRIDASAHAVYTNDMPMLRAIAALAREFSVHCHVHLSETQKENRECQERYKMTPTEVFLEAGIFDQPTTAAHCVWMSPSDLQILRQKGVNVASCPASNMKLSSGMCHVPNMYDLGINVGIGTDGAASNNSLNFFEEMKLFALTGKVATMAPSTMTPQQVLRSATRAGALAQGREDCGLIKEGFKADLIVVDVTGPNMWPQDDMPNALIYSADGKDVCLTMVDGKVLYRDGEYLTIDYEKVRREALTAKQEILRRL